MSHRTPRRRAVTIPELLVVIGVIVVLSAILLAALAFVKGTGAMTQSMNRMRQIGVWMTAYASDNREFVLPSQFDYSTNPTTGKVRSDPNQPLGDVHQGTWADILWTINDIGVAFGSQDSGVLPPGTPQYRYDSPDTTLYELMPGWEGNPFRATAPNSRPTGCVAEDEPPTPYGEGAWEPGAPGYFAANNFFNSVANGWWTTGQIKAPDRSVYLVDCVAGETIKPTEEAWDMTTPLHCGEGVVSGQVDFRYGDEFCLMLFLDTHVDPVNRFEDLADVQDNRRLKVTALDRR